MNKELLLFLDSSDDELLVRVLEEAGGEVDRDSDRQWFLHIAGAKIQYLRCEVFDDFITIGRVACRTLGKADKRVTKAFKHIESWVKANCTNQLSCRNVNVEGSAMMVADVWVGPSAKAFAESGKKSLKQSRQGFVVFEIAAD